MDIIKRISFMLITSGSERVHRRTFSLKSVGGIERSVF